MAKKQKVEDVGCAVPIDYIKVVDEMSDKAFQFCVEQLYPICDYCVLEQEDIRRVDLKEWLTSFNNSVLREEHGKKQGALNYYISILKLYFEEFLKCKDESMAAKYKNRAFELMKNALSENGTLEDIEDIVLIFIVLFRTLKDRFDDIDKYLITKITFDLKIEDAELLKIILKHKKLVPSGIGEKAKFFGRIFVTTYEKHMAIKLAYVNNVLFLCRGLQKRGAFWVEDE